MRDSDSSVRAFLVSIQQKVALHFAGDEGRSKPCLSLRPLCEQTVFSAVNEDGNAEDDRGETQRLAEKTYSVGNPEQRIYFA
jgi:hypothetical protein